jgi:hypothetical protein
LIFIDFITLTPTLSHQGRGGWVTASRESKLELLHSCVPKLELENKKQKICTLSLLGSWSSIKGFRTKVRFEIPPQRI